jgi:hypothetical protein
VARLLAEAVAECAGLADVRRRGSGTLTISLHWKPWRLQVAAARVDCTRTPDREPTGTPAVRRRRRAPVATSGHRRKRLLADAQRALRRAVGPCPGAADSPTGTRPTAFGHGGSGGFHGFADPEVGLAVGLTRTTVGGGGALGIGRRVRDALGVPS